jgi:hypothetical protein
MEEGGIGSVDGDLDVRILGARRSIVNSEPDTLVMPYRPKTSTLIPLSAMMEKHSAQASDRPSATTGMKMDGRIIHIETVNIRSLMTRRSKIAWIFYTISSRWFSEGSCIPHRSRRNLSVS